MANVRDGMFVPVTMDTYLIPEIQPTLGVYLDARVDVLTEFVRDQTFAFANPATSRIVALRGASDVSPAKSPTSVKYVWRNNTMITFLAAGKSEELVIRLQIGGKHIPRVDNTKYIWKYVDTEPIFNFPMKIADNWPKKLRPNAHHFLPTKDGVEKTEILLTSALGTIDPTWILSLSFSHSLCPWCIEQR